MVTDKKISKILIFISVTGFIIFIVLVFLYLRSVDDSPQPVKLDPLPKVINQTPVKICLLLTMYITNNNKRIYEKSVYDWLSETNIDIFIVDSSNRGLDIHHPRLSQCIFQQGSIQGRTTTNLELNSILKACDKFNDFREYDMVFKITGKYFTFYFDRNIDRIPTDADIIAQNRTDTCGQNSEIVGFKQNVLRDIIDLFIAQGESFEASLLKLLPKKDKYKSYRLEPMKIHTKTKRTDGEVLEYL